MLFNTFGENYYIDLDKLEKEIELDSATGETQFHLVKYEMIKTMIEVLITEREDADEALGPKTAVSLPYKLAFNTLLNNGVLKKY